MFFHAEISQKPPKLWVFSFFIPPTHNVLSILSISVLASVFFSKFLRFSKGFWPIRFPAKTEKDSSKKVITK